MSAPPEASAEPASTISFTALVAGVLTAYGASAVLISLVAGIARGADFRRTLVGGTWDHLGTTGGVLVGSSLLVAWLYGGYVAGRMAGRDGYRHGVWMFVLGILVVVTVAAVVSRFNNTASVLQSLRVIGVPVFRREWKEVISVPGVASLVAMFAGALLGAALGETAGAAPAKPAAEEELVFEPAPLPQTAPSAREREPEALLEPEAAEAEPAPAMTSLWDAFTAGSEPRAEGAEPSPEREEAIRARDRDEAADLAESHERPWMRPAEPTLASWTEPPEPALESTPASEPEPLEARRPFTEPEPFARPLAEPLAEPEPVAVQDESLWGQPPPSYGPPPAVESYPIPRPPPLVPIEELSEEEAARRRHQDEAARAYDAARDDRF